MPKVYVVQKQMRFDHDEGEFVPRFNLDSAKQYGDLEYLLSPTASPFNPDSIIPELHDKLYNFKSTDYLLLLGNPCLIGFVCTIATYYSDGDLRLLQWHGREQKYILIEAYQLLT